jgi:hypothetical protein
MIRAETKVDLHIEDYRWSSLDKVELTNLHREAEVVFGRPGRPVIEVTIVERKDGYGDKANAKARIEVPVAESDVQRIGGHVSVTMERTPSHPTLDQALWVAIRNRTRAISFENYRDFIIRVLENEAYADLKAAVVRREGLSKYLRGVGAYQALKYITEAFLVLECGVRIDRDRRHHAFDPDEETRRFGELCTRDNIEMRLIDYLGGKDMQLLPYLKRVVEAAFPQFERELRGAHREVSGADRLLLVNERLDQPLLVELIHTYWLEEGMLMQTINAVSQRFQNDRGFEDRDALANMEMDPVRPLNNLLWGWTRDGVNRLSIRQRAFEYLHEYGLMLYGRATTGISPVDNRSKFLEAFHNLLYQTSVFYKEDFQTTVIADGFPLLNALKEVHLVLAQGAHNQFGDLPWTARVETLLTQFILGRPEMRDWLQSRAMVPYTEEWMPQVDTMKTLQGWSDTSVTYFRDLAIYGEQLLLSIRYGDWIELTVEDHAKNWARYFRPEVQGYLHAYRAVTGVDLTNPLTAGTIDATLPAIHLQRRLLAQRAMPEAQNILDHTPAAGRLEHRPGAGRLEFSRMPNRVRRAD